MDWDFTYTEEDMLAFTAFQYRRSRAASVLLWITAALAALFGASLLAQGVGAALRAGRLHATILPGNLFWMDWGPLFFLGSLALVLFALAGWLIYRATPGSLARTAVRKARRASPQLFGPWHVALSEEQFVICWGGAQQAADPSVVDEALVCGVGLLVYTHGKKASVCLPARAFESGEALSAAAAEFGRCAALARARLLERQAELLAGGAAELPLPPVPPLPGGEEAAFAAPIRLRQEELFSALYAANRKLKPQKRAFRAAALGFILGLLMGCWGAANGDIAYAVFMFGVALLMGFLLLGRAPFVLKSGVRRMVSSEQAVRLTAPGWLVLGAEGFTYTSGALCSYLPYRRLNAAAQSGEYLFLLFEQRFMLVVPKRGFESPARAAEALRFLEQKIQGRKGK